MRALVAPRIGRSRPAAEHAFRSDAIEAAFRGAVASYRLRPWSGPVGLFRPPLDRRFEVSGGRCVDAAREYVFHDNGWLPWLPTLRVVEVAGDHDSMVLEPHVRVLAARIRGCVAETEAQAQSARPERSSHEADSRAPLSAAAE